MVRKKHCIEWTYNQEETQNHIDRPKIYRNGDKEFKNHKDKELVLEKKIHLVFKDHPSYPVSMMYFISGAVDEICSFRSSFILDNQRIRSIDYTPVKNRYMLSETHTRSIGWHENILYYDQEKGIINEHNYELGDINPMHLIHFNSISCERWNIENKDEDKQERMPF